MGVESVIIKKTILGRGRTVYQAGKKFTPPFDKAFNRDIIPMLTDFPEYFQVVGAHEPVVQAADDIESLAMAADADAGIMAADPKKKPGRRK